jgi:hypothetical protein
MHWRTADSSLGPRSIRNDKWFTEARQPKPEARAYLNSSIAAASTSLPGRVSDSGSVASG